MQKCVHEIVGTFGYHHHGPSLVRWGEGPGSVCVQVVDFSLFRCGPLPFSRHMVGWQSSCALVPFRL